MLVSAGTQFSLIVQNSPAGLLALWLKSYPGPGFHIDEVSWLKLLSIVPVVTPEAADKNLYVFHLEAELSKGPVESVGGRSPRPGLKAEAVKETTQPLVGAYAFA